MWVNGVLVKEQAGIRLRGVHAGGGPVEGKGIEASLLQEFPTCWSLGALS